MELCVGGGYYLPPERQERILAEPPEARRPSSTPFSMEGSYDVDTEMREAICVCGFPFS